MEVRPEMQDRSTNEAAYRWHRLALSCVNPSQPRASLARALAALAPGELARFTDFLVWHKMAALWHERLETADLLDSVDANVAETLHASRVKAAALYIVQQQSLIEIDHLFERHAIPYVAIKGSSMRECLYSDASLRPASDIDILVAPAHRLEAARLLTGAGYEFHREPENIDHEATFSRSAVDIDLHWNILRNGRTRCEVVSGLLGRRQRQASHWGLSPSDTVVVMLVHPAFKDYVTNMGLISVVDFIMWLRNQSIDWTIVAGSLEQTGLKVAAWTVLSWFRMIAPANSIPIPETFCELLQPGRMRQRYLQQWLSRDLATRWLDRPLRIQLGFTLALHDRPTDAVGAIRGWLHARATRNADPMLNLGREDEALTLV